VDKPNRTLYRRKLARFICWCSVFLMATSVAQAASPQKSIMILGDSISAAYGLDIEEGWVALLEQRLGNKPDYNYQVINASISGNTSGDGLGRLPLLLKQYSPEIIVIELGGNDGLRGFPVKILQRNLQAMIDMSQAANAKVILAGIEIPPNYGQRYTDLFRKTFQTVADNNDVVFIPFILENIALRPELMQDDGIHPTKEAQSILLENIWPAIEGLM